MVAVERSDSPGGLSSVDPASEMVLLVASGGDVRELQRKLWVAAKRSPGRRFHALFDRIWRGEILQEAWVRVQRNKGAAGVDKQTLAAVREYGVARLLGELQRDLRDGSYRPEPVRRVEIPKPSGGKRPLGIPTVRDRIAQQAARIVLEPIFEADIRNYFSEIDHERLLALVAERVSDRRVLALLRGWLKAGVMHEGEFQRTLAGTPQGGVISPLLSNIYLQALDRAFADEKRGTLVRYADDFVVICRSEAQARAAQGLAGTVLAGLGLELHPEKTKVVDLREGREGFDFLGCHFRARVSGRMLERGIRRYYLHRWPSQRAMKRVRAKIKAKTGRGRAGQDMREVIAELNPILRGWGNYFRTGNPAKKFNQIDHYVEDRLWWLMRKRYGRNLKPGQGKTWTREFFEAHGLYRLRGTIRYPGLAS